MPVFTPVLGETLPTNSTLVSPDLEVDGVVVEPVVRLRVGTQEQLVTHSTSDTLI